MIERTYYPINEESARLSHMNMSMRDYEEGSATQGYLAQVESIYDLADRIAKKKPRSASKAYFLADKYARRLARNINEDSCIGMMCPSVLVSGAGNFPVKKKERQVAAWDKNHQDYKEVMKIKDKMLSILNGTEIIASGDEDAIERLEEKIEQLVDVHERMKSVNAYYRKQKTLDGCPDLSGDQIEKLKSAMNSSYEDRPFPAYKLSNSSAIIRNTKRRLEKLKKSKEAGTKETTNEFFKVVENADNMRLQLFFDDRPDDKTRLILKDNGFRWAPSKGCWQRPLTDNAKYALKTIINELEKNKEEA